MEVSKHLDSDDISGGDEKYEYSQKKTSKHKKSKKKSRKRNYSSSSEELEDRPTKKLKSKHKKKCKKRHKHSKDEKNKDRSVIKNKKDDDNKETIIGPEIPTELLQKAQSMAPMSKEDWEKKQNTIRRVFDEKTGRTRLVRGEGEIIEEIVSRERHQEINRQATLGDGNFFQSKLNKNI